MEFVYEETPCIQRRGWKSRDPKHLAARRETNKQTAKLSRDRRRAWKLWLEQHVEELTKEYNAMRKEVIQLQIENRVLTQELYHLSDLSCKVVVV